MMRIQRVLFPTDFSPQSVDAFSFAAHIARVHQAELHLLHVDILHQDDPDILGQSMAEVEKHHAMRDGWARGRLRDLTRDQDLMGVSVFREVCWDVSAADQITEYAGENEIDLVVFGTHGSSGFRRHLLGSVVAEVIHTAPCSVLVVPRSGGQPRRPSFRKVLAPVDFSKPSREGLSVACEIVVDYGARFDLLHVRGKQTHPILPNEGSSPLSPPPTDALPRLEASMRLFLDEASGSREILAEFKIREGHPGHEIPRFAKTHDSDLIVIASHGSTGTDRFLLGSTAEGVVAEAPCPVLVVKPQGRHLVTSGHDHIPQSSWSIPR